MKKNYELLKEVTDRLPDFCLPYLYNGQSENSRITVLNYARDIEYFLQFAIDTYPYFCDKHVADISVDDLSRITANDINLYLSVMDDRGLSPKTRARRKSSVSGLFKYLVDTERKLEYNPVIGSSVVKIPEKNYVEYLKRDEQEVLLNCIMYGTGLTKDQMRFHNKEWKRDLAIVFLFLDTGLRISELQGLDIADVDFSEHSVHVLRKRGKEQQVYFSDEAGEYLLDYLEERKGYVGDDPLFLSLRGSRIAVRTIQAMLDKYMEASLPQKAKQISPHKLRSSFAMGFYKGSGDILLLKEKMGHKSIIATNVYVTAAGTEELANTRNWRNSQL